MANFLLMKLISVFLSSLNLDRGVDSMPLWQDLDLLRSFVHLIFAPARVAFTEV
jgi:hypothetical protein